MKHLRILDAKKVLPLALMLSLVGSATAQSWTERDLKKADPKNGKYTYVYRYVNEIVSVDSNKIVVKELRDKGERTINLNDTSVYIETGRAYQGDSRKNFKEIPVKDVAEKFKPGDTVAIQVDTWWASPAPKRAYKKDGVVNMDYSEDPKKVVTFYVPSMKILLKNKDKNSPAVQALMNQKKRTR